ncbi:hypothetical protein MG293_004398 [Ovis ammon polii]|uniref:Uncharacterized protein n=1 Tax=Ovis ammon polii TaxID=230172 RepID=A0AAD4UGA0_OVIAM|nr:hypothetical protein MG293_004398 [Ovis ammon polii]
MQKGSLNLLRQKWESSDYQKSEYSPRGSRCRLFQPQENKLLEPEGEVASTLVPPDPPSLLRSVREEVLSAEPEGKCPEDKSEYSRDCAQLEVLKEGSLSGRHRIERFSIALDELKSVFEAPRSGNRQAGPAEYSRKLACKFLGGPLILPKAMKMTFQFLNQQFENHLILAFSFALAHIWPPLETYANAVSSELS